MQRDQRRDCYNKGNESSAYRFFEKSWKRPQRNIKFEGQQGKERPSETLTLRGGVLVFYGFHTNYKSGLKQHNISAYAAEIEMWWGTIMSNFVPNF